MMFKKSVSSMGKLEYGKEPEESNKGKLENNV